MDYSALLSDDIEVVQKYLKLHPEEINRLMEDPEMAKFVRQHHPNSPVAQFERSCFIRPLMYAVKKERMDITDLLIENGCDINAQDKKGWSALHYAAYDYKSRDIIEKLIAHGASGLIRSDFNMTPLHYAAGITEDVNVIYQLLIVSDANSIDNDGKNALMRASFTNKNMEVVEALINVTIDINLQSRSGYTALHYAGSNSNYEAVKLLLARGADITLQSCDNKTAYDVSHRECKRIIGEFKLNQ